MTNLLQFKINVRKSHRLLQRNLKFLCEYRLSRSSCFFMQAATYKMRDISSPAAYIFLLYASLSIQPHKQKSNGVSPGDFGGQLMESKHFIIQQMHKYIIRRYN